MQKSNYKRRINTSNLILVEKRVLQVARFARYVMGASSPHAACRYGHWRGVTIMSHSVRCRYATEKIEG